MNSTDPELDLPTPERHVFNLNGLARALPTAPPPERPSVNSVVAASVVQHEIHDSFSYNRNIMFACSDSVRNKAIIDTRSETNNKINNNQNKKTIVTAEMKNKYFPEL